MTKTLLTKEHLEDLGFKPCCSFWILERKDLFGSITFTEEIKTTHELGLNSLDLEHYYCVKLRNKKQQEIRFFTEQLYVEDIRSVIKILETV